MSGHMPPLPPANRPKKGPDDAHTHPNDAGVPSDKGNLAEQGQQGNIYQNTHNQGYQQDR